jgi:VWFA-related protein
MSRHRWLGVCLATAIGLLLARPAAQVPAPPTPPSTFAIDVTVLDRAGLVPGDLLPTDVTVSVDGQARSVMWMRRVSRGPGALADASARQSRATGATTFAAEPGRTVLLVVDAASFARGNERPALQFANSFLDRLGMSDRVAVVQIPLSSDQHMALTTERSAVREALGRVAGVAERDTVLPVAEAIRVNAGQEMTTDPTRERAIETERTEGTDRAIRESSPGLAPAGAGVEQSVGRDSAAGLVSLLKAFQPIPGRKVIALVSAGFPASSGPRVDEAVAAAVAARAVVYTFGLRDSAENRRDALDPGPLEKLARATGGVFVTPGNKPDRVMDRVVTELSACYVIGVQRSDDDKGNRRRTLRVETSRRDLTLRGTTSWLARTSDLEDVVPGVAPDSGAPDPASANATGGVEYRGAGLMAVAPEPPSRSSRDGELRTALGRLFDYVEAYERQYSALVAEEDFQQRLSRSSVRLRSDFLLVKPEGTDEWMSFRDVYEVNGVPVRDRDDRLKRLFLTPGPATQAQLDAIRDESARHNIGPVERSINVPLLPLKFLNPRNRDRFRFKLAGDSDVDGVRAWRVEYRELVGPTMITDHEYHDLFTRGWFLVDQLTGAVVESGFTVDPGMYVAAVVVRYRRDEALGMWVPAEMKESYKFPRQRVGSSGTALETELEGVAKYSNFRRFQVKTEETVTIPK